MGAVAPLSIIHPADKPFTTAKTASSSLPAFASEQSHFMWPIWPQLKHLPLKPPFFLAPKPLLPLKPLKDFAPLNLLPFAVAFSAC